MASKAALLAGARGSMSAHFAEDGGGSSSAETSSTPPLSAKNVGAVASPSCSLELAAAAAAFMQVGGSRLPTMQIIADCAGHALMTCSSSRQAARTSYYLD